MESLRVQLMGPPVLERQGQVLEVRSRKLWLLLAHLLLEKGQHTRDTLAGLFWPDSEPDTARSALRTLLSQLRKLLGARLHTEGTLVELRLEEADVVDVLARGPFGSGHLLQGIEVPEEGALQDWLLALREHLRNQQVRRIEERLDTTAAHQDPGVLLQQAWRLFELDRCAESSTRRLMVLLSQSGHAGDVQEVLELHRTALKAHLGLEPAPELISLVSELQHAAPALPSPSPTELPRPLTRFVGRKAELQQVAELLHRPEVRLLTLQGPGGMGKTRLALEAAHHLNDGSWPGRVVFLPLEHLTAPSQLVSHLASMLRVEPSREEEEARTVLQALNARPTLLVLDNFEHVLPAASTVSGWLMASPELQVLVTSRERLGLSGEQVMVLSGLSDPQEGGEDAVELFLERAQESRLDLQLQEDDLQVVREICQQLGGMPLAIELCAAWVKVLCLQDILQEVQADLDVLAQPSRSVPVRQQSMRNVLNASWDMLSVAEQEALAGLSVFRGGFTREAARAVCRVGIQVLARLVDTSMLRVDSSGRFERHPLVQQYASEKLRASGKLQALQEQHALHFLQMAETTFPHLEGPRMRQHLQALEAEQQNLSGALEHFVTTRQHKKVLSMGAHLALYWSAGGRLQDGIRHVYPLLNDPQDAAGSLEHGRALCVLGYLIWKPFPDAQNLHITRQGVELCRTHQDPRFLRHGLLNLIDDLTSGGHFAEAWEAIEDLRQHSEIHQDPYGRAHCFDKRAFWHHLQRQFPEALEQASEGLRQMEKLQNPRGQATALLMLGMLHAETGQPEEALGFLNQAMVVNREAGLIRRMHLTRKMVATIHYQTGQFEACQAHLEQALQFSRHTGNVRELEHLLSLQAFLHLDQGDWEGALRSVTEARRQVLNGQETQMEEYSGFLMGRIEQVRGNFPEALRLYLEVLCRPYRFERVFVCTVALAFLLSLPFRQADHQRVATLLGMLPRLQQQASAVYSPQCLQWLSEAHARTTVFAVDQLGQQAFDRAFEQGQQWPFEEMPTLLEGFLLVDFA